MSDLLDIIDDLTVGRVITTRKDDGGKHLEHHGPLFAQLRDAVASSLVSGQVDAGGRAGVPIDADALEKYTRIEETVSAWFVGFGLGVPRLTPEENLRAVYAHAWAREEPDDTVQAVIAGWRVMILDKFEPPTILELIDTRTNEPEACPDCGAGWFLVPVYAYTDARGRRRWETDRRVALVARYRPDGHGGLDRTVVECGCCGWRACGVTEIRALAFDIESRVSETVGSE
ncbi:DUF7341 domain-containing protein [Agromyces sp. SYSU T00194]|uniref:DUF7341 domain-containing protein n=1 Tax=Agromyces chitinivorans TaxID=3158560 RepID=UPI0033926DC8